MKKQPKPTKKTKRATPAFGWVGPLPKGARVAVYVVGCDKNGRKLPGCDFPSSKAAMDYARRMNLPK